MARYTYKAVDPSGRLVEGNIEAANEADLELRVANMELDLIRFKSAEKQSFSFQSARVEPKELINFSYHLEQLLKAGVPLIEALQDLRDSTNRGLFRDVISGLIDTISSGSTFSEALAQHPKVFSKVYINMIHVGENSGQLVKVLQDLTSMLRWQYELTAKAKQIMIYPSIVLVIVVAVIIFLMTYLMPLLIPFLKMARQEIPWHTELLIATSNFMVDNWFFLLIIPPVLFLSFIGLTKHSPSLRYWLDRAKFKIPLIGPINYKIKLARFCNYFAMMYSSGITVLDAVAMGKRVMDNSALEAALDRVQEQISDGELISTSFTRAGLFPALIVRMLKVGENTGAMSEALLNVSYFYESEVKDSIDRFGAMITPAITLVLGAVIGWIGLSVIGPIYDAVVSLPI